MNEKSCCILFVIYIVVLRTVVFVRHSIVIVYLYVFHFQLTFILIKLNKGLCYHHIPVFIRENVSCNRNLRNRSERSSRFSQRPGWEFHPSATWHHPKVQTVEDEGITSLLNFGNRHPLTQHHTPNNGILRLTYFYVTLYEQHVTTDHPHSWIL
jgi:hypothetical protein